MVQATMANTRRIAFAIWWKVCLAWIAVSAVAGFVSYLLPFGQVQYWLAASAVTLLGESAATFLFGSMDGFDRLIPVVAALPAAALIFLFINWIVASHVGRNFGRFRLALERVG